MYHVHSYSILLWTIVIGFSKSVHVWIITMVFHLLLVNFQIKGVTMSPKRLYSWWRRRNRVYRQKQNVKKCIGNSTKSMFPFHIFILLHRLQVLMETDVRPRTTKCSSPKINPALYISPNCKCLQTVTTPCYVVRIRKRSCFVLLYVLSWHKGCWEMSWCCCHTCIVLTSSWHVTWSWCDS